MGMRGSALAVAFTVLNACGGHSTAVNSGKTGAEQAQAAECRSVRDRLFDFLAGLERMSRQGDCGAVSRGEEGVGRLGAEVASACGDRGEKTEALARKRVRELLTECTALQTSSRGK